MKSETKFESELEILAVTYIGTGKFGFYKDCHASAIRLAESLELFKIPLLIYDFTKLSSTMKMHNTSILYFFTRYGAGAWFWKPTVMKMALSEYSPKLLIYLDADCVVRQDPRKELTKALANYDVALFKQTAKLKGRISNRAARILRLSDQVLSESNILTAGIIMVRNSQRTINFLMLLDLALSNPRLLLHPHFYRGHIRHFHDQSVLSGLIASGTIQCQLIDSGFYSMGSESTTNILEDAWIYTGNIEVQEMKNIRGRLLSISDYYSRLAYEILKSVVITPLHILLYESTRFKEKSLYAPKNKQ